MHGNNKDTPRLDDTKDTCKYCSANIYEENVPENRVKAVYIVGLSAIILALSLIHILFISL